MGKHLHVNKTVSRNFIVDIMSGIQNFLGMNLDGYQNMVDKGMHQIQEDIQDKKLKWYRYEITQLGSGALSITLYGEEEDETN